MQSLDQAFASLDRYVAATMESTNVPAMAIGVTDRANLIRASTYGFADVARRTPATPETLFEIGSIGKSFTSIALLQLWEEGQLDLHQPVAHYLPWFEIKSEFEPITVHHLLSHTAGITHGPELPGEARYEVWALRETEASTPPGSFYHYSDVGYKTLGVLLEEVVGQPYGDIIRERILRPLGMTQTQAIVLNADRPRLAVGYEAFYDDRPSPSGRPVAPATWLEHAEGAGSVASTPADMATYLRMLLNRGRGSNGPILSEEAFGLLTGRVISAEEEGEGSFYGYGLVVGAHKGCDTLSHGGGMVGYYAYIVADIDTGLGVVVMMNGPGGHADEDVAYAALDLLHAARQGRTLPTLSLPDPTAIDDAATYAGTYRLAGADSETFSITAGESDLTMSYQNGEVVLERRGHDCFFAPHPDFELFLLQFGRQGGQVVDAFYGSRWFVNDAYTGPISFDYPEEWDVLTGHYRSHNPWLSNFRVVLRKGNLMLIEPSGGEEPMTPIDDMVFRVGEHESSPERICFDAVVNGQALRANLSNGDYYRTFTL